MMKFSRSLEDSWVDHSTNHQSLSYIKILLLRKFHLWFFSLGLFYHLSFDHFFSIVDVCKRLNKNPLCPLILEGLHF